MSLYDYCSGDPVNGLDPTGRCLSKQLENPENTASWFDQGTNFGQAQQQVEMQHYWGGIMDNTFYKSPEALSKNIISRYDYFDPQWPVVSGDGEYKIDNDGMLTTGIRTDKTSQRVSSSLMDLNGNYVAPSKGVFQINANTDLYGVAPRTFGPAKADGGVGLILLGDRMDMTNNLTGQTVVMQVADYGPFDPGNPYSLHPNNLLGEGSRAVGDKYGLPIIDVGWPRGPSVGWYNQKGKEVSPAIPVTVTIYPHSAAPPAVYSRGANGKGIQAPVFGLQTF